MHLTLYTYYEAIASIQCGLLYRQLRSEAKGLWGVCYFLVRFMLLYSDERKVSSPERDRIPHSRNLPSEIFTVSVQVYTLQEKHFCEKYFFETFVR